MSIEVVSRREWAEAYAKNAGITLAFRHEQLDRFICGITHKVDGTNEVMYDEKALAAALDAAPKE